MEINDRLKKVIFKKLYNDLSHIEIIPYEDSIWFIDRDKKYWYLEFKKNGHLWWRHGYFNRFFIAFSLERIDYEPIIAEWVEDVLNHKVITTKFHPGRDGQRVEDVLNHKVITTQTPPRYLPGEVEDVLNNKVITTQRVGLLRDELVEDVLNNKVITTLNVERICDAEVEQVLNSK
jgi:hypothetical protein